ncbi:Lrp/AsnC family transcriptional regulator [Nesterenkonia populi]
MESLDSVDREILEILQLDARISMTDLAKQVLLSQPATSARVKRLEQKGVIDGYTARLDAEALGISTHAMVRLRTTHAHIPKALEAFGDLPEIHRIYRVTGEDCFVLDVYAADAARLEQVIDALGRFGPVSTFLVLREYPAHLLRNPAGPRRSGRLRRE